MVNMSIFLGLPHDKPYTHRTGSVRCGQLPVEPQFCMAFNMHKVFGNTHAQHLQIEIFTKRVPKMRFHGNQQEVLRQICQILTKPRMCCRISCWLSGICLQKEVLFGTRSTPKKGSSRRTSPTPRAAASSSMRSCAICFRASCEFGGWGMCRRRSWQNSCFSPAIFWKEWAGTAGNLIPLLAFGCLLPCRAAKNYLGAGSESGPGQRSRPTVQTRYTAHSRPCGCLMHVTASALMRCKNSTGETCFPETHPDAPQLQAVSHANLCFVPRAPRYSRVRGLSRNGVQLLTKTQRTPFCMPRAFVSPSLLSIILITVLVTERRAPKRKTLCTR